MQHSGFYSHRYGSAYKNGMIRSNPYLTQNWIQHDEMLYRRKPVHQKKSEVSVDGDLLCTFMESMDRCVKLYDIIILYIPANLLAGTFLYKSFWFGQLQKTVCMSERFLPRQIKFMYVRHTWHLWKNFEVGGAKLKKIQRRFSEKSSSVLVYNYRTGHTEQVTGGWEGSFENGRTIVYVAIANCWKHP